jgi:hypothetical protein
VSARGEKYSGIDGISVVHFAVMGRQRRRSCEIESLICTYRHLDFLSSMTRFGVRRETRGSGSNIEFSGDLRCRESSSPKFAVGLASAKTEVEPALQSRKDSADLPAEFMPSPILRLWRPPRSTTPNRGVLWTLERALDLRNLETL